MKKSVKREYVYKKCNVKTCIHHAGGYCTCCSRTCELLEKEPDQEY